MHNQKFLRILESGSLTWSKIKNFSDYPSSRFNAVTYRATSWSHSHLSAGPVGQSFLNAWNICLKCKKSTGRHYFYNWQQNFLSVNDLHYCIPFFAVKCQPFSSNEQNKLCLFKELRHEIYQNSNSGNCREIEWNTKITTRNINVWKTKDIQRRHRWINLKKTETVCNCGVWKLLT